MLTPIKNYYYYFLAIKKLISELQFISAKRLIVAIIAFGAILS